MKSILKKIIPGSARRAFLVFLNRLWVFICSHLKLKNRVLFYTVRSDNGLTDNAKILYDSLDCEKIIYAHKPPHFKPDKVEAYYKILTSKVIVTDDYCRYMRALKLRPGQKLLQIWHGCGFFKCFALDAVKDSERNYELAAHSQYSAVAVTSEKSADVFAKAFGIDRSKCIVTGIPRNDELINNSENLKDVFFNENPGFKNKRIYLYCPTFREQGGERVKFDPCIDWEKLSASLEDDEIFIISRHPLADYKLTDRDFCNIKDLTDVPTLNLVSASSVFITDYSSSVHDAVLLNKPVVFYCPDYKSYERNLYIAIPDDLPGEFAVSDCELLEKIRRAPSMTESDKYQTFKKEQLGACDGHSLERLKGLIEDWMK